MRRILPHATGMAAGWREHGALGVQECLKVRPKSHIYQVAQSQAPHHLSWSPVPTPLQLMAKEAGTQNKTGMRPQSSVEPRNYF